MEKSKATDDERIAVAAAVVTFIVTLAKVGFTIFKTVKQKPQ